MEGANPRTLVLVGTAYSGSTHLGGLLTANIGAAYVGEVSRLPRFVEQYGLDDRFYGCLICEATGQPCPVWSDETIAAAAAAGPPGVADVVRARTTSSLVVDGSKWPAWLRMLDDGRGPGAPPVSAAIVARSPLRFVVSATAITGAPPWLVAQWWRDLYTDALRTVARRAIPNVIVRNEDVRRDPMRTVAAVASLVGTTAPTELADAVPTHSVGGNPLVQQGYASSSLPLWERFGGVHGNFTPPADERDWAKVSEEASVTAYYRPRTRRQSRALAQTVMDCPGLVDVAQAIGYEMAQEVALFVEEIEDPPEPTEPAGPAVDGPVPEEDPVAAVTADPPVAAGVADGGGR